MLPNLKPIKTKREYVGAFAGYNHNLRIADDEFYDMTNMSSSFYPVLSPRGKRGILTQLTDPNGLTAKTNLFWVNGTTLYYNGVAVEELTLSDSPKQFVSMGAFLLIWPDKVYFDTYKYDQGQTPYYGNLGASITIAGTTTCTLTKEDGTSFGTPTVSDTEPADPEDGALWINTSESIHTLNQYFESTNTWVQVASTHIKLAATNIGAAFKAYDGVTISGFSETSLNGDYILQGVGTDYIIITGILDTTITQTGVKVERKIPDMDFLAENQNRVWGCSSAHHEIYACKLGDPTNWYCYQRLSTDSYAATIGSDGDFTGACSYGSNILFWKEDMLHKVSGSMPANFSIIDVPCRGVEKNSEKSLVMLNEVLFYKSRSCVCAYDGSIPVSISDALGDVRYSNAAAGGVNNKYYISMQDTSWHMFVYDMRLKMWHREDDTHASYFATHEGELFYIDTDKIMTVGGRLSVHAGGVQYDATNGGPEQDFEWSVETGDIGLNMIGNKYISRILIRLDFNTTEPVEIALKYNSSGEWIPYTKAAVQTLQTMNLSIQPRRCDHLRMKISGKGDVKVYSIAKVIEEGSDG